MIFGFELSEILKGMRMMWDFFDCVLFEKFSVVAFVFVSGLSECVHTPFFSNQTSLSVAAFFIQHWRKFCHLKE